MAAKFKIGDKVSWNSEAGRVSGTIIKIHTSDFDYKGYTHHASEKEPQYEIKSSKTDHIAAHKESALTKISWTMFYWFRLNLRLIPVLVLDVA